MIVVDLTTLDDPGEPRLVCRLAGSVLDGAIAKQRVVADLVHSSAGPTNLLYLPRFLNRQVAGSMWWNIERW